MEGKVTGFQQKQSSNTRSYRKIVLCLRVTKTEVEENGKWRWGYDDYGDDDQDGEEEEEDKIVNIENFHWLQWLC